MSDPIEAVMDKIAAEWSFVEVTSGSGVFKTDRGNRKYAVSNVNGYMTLYTTGKEWSLNDKEWCKFPPEESIYGARQRLGEWFDANEVENILRMIGFIS